MPPSGWAACGRKTGAQAMPATYSASVYGWFTEGFDNPVLRDAKVLLDQLTGAFDPAAISDRAHAGNRGEGKGGGRSR